MVLMRVPRLEPVWKDVKKVIRNLGFQIHRVHPHPRDLPPEFIRIYERSRAYSMTSIDRMYGLYEAVRYLEAKRIPGAFVECGIWRGGSSMVMALSLLDGGAPTRDFYLYDTYSGMSPPTDKDVDLAGGIAQQKFEKFDRGDHSEWCYASLEEVQQNLRSTGYPEDRMRFVRGKVEETIPNVVPETIALLRLDTDFYESTYHELTHLYPRLMPGGVLIIDDYGHWKGSREATDQYFREQGIIPLLSRLDYSGRMMVKP
jgi:O-methyltransferase